jgi:EthD domain
MSQSYKILLLMKRKSGMSVEAFRDYYETGHAPFCAQYSTRLSHYIRRYLDSQNHPETGPAGELPYDVITELWFDNEPAYRATLAYLTTSIMPDEVVADENKLFDRTSFRIATVVECETDLEAVRQAQQRKG